MCFSYFYSAALFLIPKDLYLYLASLIQPPVSKIHFWNLCSRGGGARSCCVWLHGRTLHNPGGAFCRGHHSPGPGKLTPVGSLPPPSSFLRGLLPSIAQTLPFFFFFFSLVLPRHSSLPRLLQDGAGSLAQVGAPQPPGVQDQEPSPHSRSLPGPF